MKNEKTRADGEGSIYQDGKTWVAQISIKGNIVRRRCKTKAAALIKLDEIREMRRQRLNLTGANPTYKEWFEIWLKGNRRLKEGVRKSYRTNAKRYTLPTIGRYRIDEITSALLQDWVNELEDRGLAPNTIRNVAARVRTALARALRDRKIGYNPAIGLELPPIRRRRLPVALDEEQARALLEAVAQHRLYTLYVLALSTGMRQGELLALKWSDVSWRAKTISIRRTLVRVGQHTTEDTTKTEAGERVLDLSDDLVALLRTHWTTQQDERSTAVKKGMDDWNNNQRVFVNEIGREIAARNLLRQFGKAQATAEIPPIVWHDLRHTAGSLMLRRGADMLTVSKILGHSSPAVTMKIYAHAYTDQRKKATADLAGALLRRAE